MSVTTRIALFGNSYIEHMGRFWRKDLKEFIYSKAVVRIFVRYTRIYANMQTQH